MSSLYAIVTFQKPPAPVGSGMMLVPESLKDCSYTTEETDVEVKVSFIKGGSWQPKNSKLSWPRGDMHSISSQDILVLQSPSNNIESPTTMGKKSLQGDTDGDGCKGLESEERGGVTRTEEGLLVE